MSDWGYVSLAFAVAWGGVTVYAAALARRITAAGRLERRLREMVDADVARSASATEGNLTGRATPGWTAEGE